MQSMDPSSLGCRLIVITGPSGVGKGTLVKRLLECHQEIWLSISATTREPREGEIDGKHYFFVSREQFNELVKSDGFVEWAEFAGNFYGTPTKPIQQKLLTGSSVLLEIELEGARQVSETFPDALRIFIAPPNFAELEKRIRGRATDTEEAIQRRLLRAKEELDAVNEFDAFIVNDDLDTALEAIELKLSSF